MNSEVEKKVQHACATLMEHCESCRIFVTWSSGEHGTTSGYSFGAGNFYAQVGQIQEWKSRQDEYSRDDARKEGESDE